MRKMLIGTLLAAVLCTPALAQPFAYETGTIQIAGPRPAPSGDGFLNIEGFQLGSFASYGTARWDLSAAKAAFDTAFGAGNWTVSSVALTMTQANASFTTDGAMALYWSADDTTDAKTISSPLKYPLFDPNGILPPDLPVVEADPILTYTFTQVASGHKDGYNIYTPGDTGQRLAMASDILADNTLTLVFNEGDGFVAATYAGQTGAGDPNDAPELEIVAIAVGANNPPVADAGLDQTVVDIDQSHAEAVTLDGSGSTDADGTIVNYKWTEGAIVLANGASATPTVNLALGVHTVTLEVTDDDLDTDTDEVLITVNPGGTAPIAEAGAPQEATDTDDNGSEVITLDGSLSHDTDGGMIIRHEWFERGSSLGTGAVLALPLSVGIHTLELQCEDNAGWISRDWTFVKVLPANVIGRHNFDGASADSFVQDPNNNFTSPADGFGVYSRATSVNVPFVLLDDNLEHDPNALECTPSGFFPLDNSGVIKCAQQDAWFGVGDLANPDNLDGLGSVEMTFDITGFDNIEVSVDLGAFGNFENADPCDPNFIYDGQVWTATIDAGSPQTLFSSSIDEGTQYFYTFSSGRQWFENDPMQINGTRIDNELKTFTAPVSGTGSTLTVRVDYIQDASGEAMIFDDVIVASAAGGGCGPGCGDGAGDADLDDDCDVDLTDLAILLSDFDCTGGCTGDTNGDGNTDLTDLARVLSFFDATCP